MRIALTGCLVVAIAVAAASSALASKTSTRQTVKAAPTVQTRNVKGAQTDEEVLESALLVAGVTDYTAAHFDAGHASDPQGALHDAPPLVHQSESAVA